MKISKLIPLALTAAAVAILTAPAGAATFAGTRGPDVLRGTAKADVIRGKAGDDTIRGRKGNDRLYGQKGADTLVGGPGFDRLFGGPGDDIINAEDGNADTIVCGPGLDGVQADPIDTVGPDCEESGQPDPGVDFSTSDYPPPGDAGPSVPPTDGGAGPGGLTETPADPAPGPTFPLDVSVFGGAVGSYNQVESRPAGIECRDDCSEVYESGMQITLLALDPAFLRWEGACSGTDPVCDLAMDAPKSVSAYFDDPKVALNVNVQGDGAVLGSVPCGVLTTPCSADFYRGEEITLRAIGRESFLGWGGGCSGTEPTCTLILTEKTTVTATFGRRPAPDLGQFPFGP